MENKMDKTEIELINYLSHINYPEDCLYKRENKLGIDLIACDKECLNEKAVFEIKFKKTKQNILKTISKFKEVSPALSDNVTYFIVFPGDDVWTFHIYNVTPFIVDSIEFNMDDFEAMHIALPTKEFIIPGITKLKEKKQQLNWVIIFSLLSELALIILDGTGVFELTKNRLILYGIMIVTALIPFFDTISYKDITLTRK